MHDEGRQTRVQWAWRGRGFKSHMHDAVGRGAHEGDAKVEP